MISTVCKIPGCGQPRYLRNGLCREHFHQSQAEWYQAHKEQQQEYQRAWYKRNKERQSLHSRQYRIEHGQVKKWHKNPILARRRRKWDPITQRQVLETPPEKLPELYRRIMTKWIIYKRLELS